MFSLLSLTISLLLIESKYYASIDRNWSSVLAKFNALLLFAKNFQNCVKNLHISPLTLWIFQSTPLVIARLALGNHTKCFLIFRTIRKGCGVFWPRDFIWITLTQANPEIFVPFANINWRRWKPNKQCRFIFNARIRYSIVYANATSALNCVLFARIPYFCINCTSFTEMVPLLLSFFLVPSAPQNARVLNRTTTQLKLGWDPPDSPNGVVRGYQIYQQGSLFRIAFTFCWSFVLFSFFDFNIFPTCLF